jgi:transcriptional regulator with XRE-family HTH domain
MPWSVEFHPSCGRWADGLDQADAEALLAAIRVLRDLGPLLGRPLVDTVTGSRHPNMNELRPGSTGRTEIRVLFAFDCQRLVQAQRADRRRSVRSTSGRSGAVTARTKEGQAVVTNMSKWEQKILAAPGAAGRVAQIEEELRLAAGLTRLREQAGLSQRELAERLGVRQPRIAAIERSHNVTVDVLERYVGALGGQLELTVVQGGTTITLISSQGTAAPTKTSPRKAATGKAARTTTTRARKARATTPISGTSPSRRKTAKPA